MINKQQNYSHMNSSKQNYFYEERNENFPQAFSQKRIQRQPGIGKILSKYQNRRVESHDMDLALKKPVRTGMAINYSQIYNDIKLQQASPYQQESKEVSKPVQYQRLREKDQRKSQQIFKSPYNFQSATDMGRNHNKKFLPGVIVNTPRSRSRANDFSEQNQENQQKSEGKPSIYKYRIKQLKDNDKRVNFQQISQLQAMSDKSGDHRRMFEAREEKKEFPQKMSKNVSQQQKLTHSRSIGIGNHSVFQNYEFKVELDDPQDKEVQNVQNVAEEVQVEDEIKIKQITQVQQQKQRTLTQNPKQQQQNKIEQKKDLDDIVVHYEKNPSYVRSPNESKVASTIKHNDQSNFVQEINVHINLDHPQNNEELKELQQPQSQQSAQEDLVQPFSIQQYTQIYPILKSMQAALKASLINVQQLFRGIKKYLQIIAMGNLDNIDDFNLPLHKKKIIKNAIFYERVAVIVMAFSYATRTIKDAHKYLINILSYALNNSLILVKVLEQSQIPKTQQHIQGKNRTLMKSDKLSMKRNLDSLRNNNDVLIDSIYKLSKYEDVFYENLKQTIKLINKTSLQQTFYKILQYFSFYLSVSDLGHMIPFLAVAPDPYLPATVQKKYTLVIDVVELFCHGTKKSKSFVFRPYSQHFLHEMSQYYEIVSFCNAFPNQIDKIIDMVDPKGYIQQRLYKHHAVQKNKTCIKFVQRIGRPLDQLILLDNENIGGQGSIENCIHMPAWKGNKNDTILAQLCPLLAMIPIKKINSQAAVKKVRDQTIKNQKQGVKYINFGVILD